MFNKTLTNFHFLNLNELWLYFSIHIIFVLFFSCHFFFLKILKYRIDLKNNSLKNILNFEKHRTVINSLKTIFFVDNQIKKRFLIYIVSSLNKIDR